MKWFKHMTDTDADETIARLIDAMGMEGYGMWWRTLEIIAKQMNETDKCDVTYSLSRWSLLLYSHRTKVSKYLVTLECLGLAEVSKNGDECTIKIPNLLKYRDNHTRNLQATCKRLANSLQATCNQEVEVEVEVEYSPPPIVPPPSPKGGGRPRKPSPTRQDQGELFDVFWKTYPRRVGKEAARKAFAKLHPDEELLAKMIKAIEIQRASPQWMRDGGQFIPHPATWLNQHRWEDEPEPELEWIRGDPSDPYAAF